MVKFNFEGLEDKDILACYVLADTESGKINEIEFARLLDQRRAQVKQELITLEQEIEELGISDEDFERMGRIYLISMSEICSMKEAEEIYTTMELKRNEKPKGAYAKIVDSLKTPSYDSPKEKTQREVETLEWVRSGTVKLESLKKKYQRR